MFTLSLYFFPGGKWNGEHLSFTMEPVCRIKQQRPSDPDSTILCEERTKENVLKWTNQGILSLQQASAARTKLHDVKNKDVIGRLTDV